MEKKKEEPPPLSEVEKLQQQKNNAWKALKVTEGWRFMLCHTEADDLREDIETFKNMFERHLDSLEDVIKSLENDLKEAERQSSHVQRVHLHLLERLRAMQDKHVMVLQQQWDNNLQRLCSTFDCERNKMQTHSEQRRSELDEARTTVEQEHKKLLAEIDKLYNDSIASYRSVHEGCEDALVHEGQVALKEQAHKNYKLLKNLRKEQKELNELILKKHQHIQITKEKIAMVKNVEKHREKLRNVQRKNEQMERDLKNSINEVRQKTFKLRDQLAQGHLAAKKQLMDLIIQSDNTSKKLQSVIDKGQRVLRVGKMCWKVERKLEHVNKPWLLAETEGGATNSTWDFSEMPKVIHCLNSAILHREALKKERKDLGRDNVQLRLLLYKQKEGTAVKDNNLTTQQSLLTIQNTTTSAGQTTNA